MASTGLDDDFGEFATAGWSADFNLSVKSDSQAADKHDGATNGAIRDTSSVLETLNVHSPFVHPWNSTDKAAGDSFVGADDHSGGGFGDFSRFQGNGDAVVVDSWPGTRPGNSDGTRTVDSQSRVEVSAWPGEFVGSVRDESSTGETAFADFGDFSSGYVNEGCGHGAEMERRSLWPTTAVEKATGDDTFNGGIAFGDFTTPAAIKIREETQNGLDRVFDVCQTESRRLPGDEFISSVDGMERNRDEMKTNVDVDNVETVSFNVNIQPKVLQTSDVAFDAGRHSLESYGTLPQRDKQETYIDDDGFGRFGLSMDGHGDATKHKNATENDGFVVGSGPDFNSSEKCATQLVITDKEYTYNTQHLESTTQEHTDGFGDFTSSQDRHEFPSSSAPPSVVKSINELDNAFGDFSSSNEFAAFSSTSVVPSSTGATASSQSAASTGNTDDDGFGDFSSSTADDFGDFSSSVNTGNAFSPVGSTQSAFGVFASSAQTQLAAQPATPQSNIRPSVPQLHSRLDSESVQNVLTSTFTTFVASDGVQSGQKTLDFHLSSQDGLKWDQLKTLSDEVKGRFNLNECRTHQHLMDVLHVDVHAVLSPGFGGAQLQFFGDVGWLDSELSPVISEMAVPVANTLLDLSASPMPAATAQPLPLSQQAVDTNWSQSVLPEITNTAPMGKGVDVGMLDLDFFGPSPASPATPSTGESHGGLAMADLQALGLLLEPSSSNLRASTSPERKETTQSSDPLAKVFALGGQSTWFVQNSMTKVELSPEAAAVVASLPDLSFIHSTVLMFPMQFSSMEHRVSHTTVSVDTSSSDLLV